MALYLSGFICIHFTKCGAGLRFAVDWLHSVQAVAKHDRHEGDLLISLFPAIINAYDRVFFFVISFVHFLFHSFFVFHARVLARLVTTSRASYLISMRVHL